MKTVRLALVGIWRIALISYTIPSFLFLNLTQLICQSESLLAKRPQARHKHSREVAPHLLKFARQHRLKPVPWLSFPKVFYLDKAHVKPVCRTEELQAWALVLKTDEGSKELYINSIKSNLSTQGITGHLKIMKFRKKVILFFSTPSPP